MENSSSNLEAFSSISSLLEFFISRIAFILSFTVSPLKIEDSEVNN